MLLQSAQHQFIFITDKQYIIIIIWSAENGDVSFGTGVSFPGFFFSDMEINFEVLNDRILERTEIGELLIFPDPTNFDGHTPLFKSVRIIIKDDDGEINDIEHYKLLLEDPSL